ncbi:hypothetical protein Skr01_69020 [Sphaerisporangium krabiense]|uniref:Prenyltransferase n=1 Tax=Sphaerisporangium krabiense TaxID=763782 RepID=A0A7W8Z6U9_9ACTN|nr:hypothetical protein [Sphaerisporangium krabiense]MBB5628444.1 hypothetical protein [Sphaerisporangium krabiense]GII66817.1 hypothetical protein Skr01_69020 [Sphaerisporangium krabiense]
MADADILERAEEFLWRNARLVDRLRFEHLFRGGGRELPVAAVRAYQNSDGGFGNALEPDLRGPGSQPEPTSLALQMLDELGATGDPAVPKALDYLASITRPDGGVPFVLPSSRRYPHGPWWRTEDDPPGTLVATANVVGILYKNGIRHSWTEPATEFCWRELERLTGTWPYEARSFIPFLDYVPDRDRAEAVFERVGKLILQVVEFDPDAEGEVHRPLDFAPRPDTIARRLFGDDVIEKHLDALAAAQKDDGGWTFDWQIWTPVTEPEWRGWVTVRALKTLRAYDRL